MSQSVKSFFIMISAPSDVHEEIQICKEVINEWNVRNSFTHNIVLQSLHWKDNVYSAIGSHPQKIINEQIVTKSDLMICIFASTIGTPTYDNISGTIEEIDEHIKSGKNVMLFFRNQISSDCDAKQLKEVQNFKSKIKSNALYTVYNNENDFKYILENKLSLFINDNWVNKESKHENTNKSEFQIIYDFSELLNYFSSIVPCNSEIQEDINQLLLDNIKGLRLLLGKKNENLSTRDLNIIKEYLDSIWYSYNCRTDIKSFVGNKSFDIPDTELKKRIFRYFKKTSDTKINYSLIAEFAGNLWEELENKSCYTIV